MKIKTRPARSQKRDDPKGGHCAEAAAGAWTRQPVRMFFPHTLSAVPMKTAFAYAYRLRPSNLHKTDHP
jgi:hypothetical protein